MSWQDVKQPAAAHALQAALSSNRLPHALLFLGAPDSGQMQAALELAKALVCQTASGSEGCGRCLNCQQAEKGVYADLHVIRPEEDSRVIKVEQVRESIRQASLKPLRGDVKIFIIEPSEQLNETAQNAFLKTLEEPEAFTYFILIANASEPLLPTLRSRCRTIHFVSGDWSADDASGWRAAYLQAKEFVWNDKPAPELSGLKRDELMHLIDNLVMDAREILILKTAGEGMLLSAQDLSFKQQMSAQWDAGALMDLIELLADFKEKIGNSVNVKLAMWVLWDEVSRLTTRQRAQHV